MNCPKCDADVGDSYEPDDRSMGIRGGWYCDACELAIGEHEVPREPLAAGDVETRPARESRGDRPLGTPLSELSMQPGPADDLGHRISMEVLMPPDSVLADGEIAEPSEVPLAVTPHQRSEAGFTWNTKGADLSAVAPSRHYLAPLLTTAALALSTVGISINGWFARSLGSSDLAGWLFLAVGVAADLAALVLPSTAAGLWHAGQRATALVGWVIWSVTFVFAVTAGIGFASVNIADVTLTRASRITPAVGTAQAALADAMSARDRECRGGVGKVCREREEAVADRRRSLDSAMHDVEQTADPQTEAASRIVAWVSMGTFKPAGADFAILRLILLALLPQIGGLLLLIRRRS